MLAQGLGRRKLDMCLSLPGWLATRVGPAACMSGHEHHPSSPSRLASWPVTAAVAVAARRYLKLRHTMPQTNQHVYSISMAEHRTATRCPHTAARSPTSSVVGGARGFRQTNANWRRIQGGRGGGRQRMQLREVVARMWCDGWPAVGGSAHGRCRGRQRTGARAVALCLGDAGSSRGSATAARRGWQEWCGAAR